MKFQHLDPLKQERGVQQHQPARYEASKQTPLRRSCELKACRRRSFTSRGQHASDSPGWRYFRTFAPIFRSVSCLLLINAPQGDHLLPCTHAGCDVSTNFRRRHNATSEECSSSAWFCCTHPSVFSHFGRSVFLSRPSTTNKSYHINKTLTLLH